MFASRTVFVVGAGASADLDLPLGSRLRDNIAALLAKVQVNAGTLEGPPPALNAMYHRERFASDVAELTSLARAAQSISQNLPLVRSIDEFIDHHNGNKHIEFMAKVGICASILEAEKRSSLLSWTGHRASLNLKGLAERDAAILQLWYLLRAGIHASTPAEIFKNVTFVVFNYDRCLEVFLSEALVGMFNIDRDEALSLVAGADIVHPYGIIGELGASGAPQFGINEGIELGAIAENIRTFGESERDAATMEKLSEILRTAANIVFLGYAFHQQNMEFLECNRGGTYPKVYSTAVGLPEEHWDDIRTMLLKRWGKVSNAAADFRPVFRACKGAKLLRTFEKPLLR